MNPQEALETLCRRWQVSLPAPSAPVGSYQPLIQIGGFAFLSGQISKDGEGRILAGKVGGDLTLEQGQEAARYAALQALSLLRSEVGLEAVDQIARVVGYIQSGADFHRQSDVMNAASEVFLEVFGARGRHARTSVSAVSLPLNAAVEIELTIKLK